MKRVRSTQKQFDKFHIDVSLEESLLFQEPVIKKPFADKFNFMNIKTITVIVALHLVPLAVIMGSSTQERPEPVPAPTVPLVPEPLPSPLPKPNPLPPAPSLTTTYTVKQGDTITKIVKKYKLSTKQLLELNHIKDPNSIKVGQVLKFTH